MSKKNKHKNRAAQNRVDNRSVADEASVRQAGAVDATTVSPDIDAGDNANAMDDQIVDIARPNTDAADGADLSGIGTSYDINALDSDTAQTETGELDAAADTAAWATATPTDEPAVDTQADDKADTLPLIDTAADGQPVAGDVALANDTATEELPPLPDMDMLADTDDNAVGNAATTDENDEKACYEGNVAVLDEPVADESVPTDTDTAMSLDDDTANETDVTDSCPETIAATDSEHAADGKADKDEKELSEEEKAKLQAKQEKKALRKQKTKAWFAKHKVLVIVLCLVVLLAVGLTVGHFVTCRNVVFVHNAEDLLTAIEKGKKTELILKNDVVVEQDLTIKGFDLDLNNHTLLVKGTLTLDSGDKTAFAGQKKYIWSAPQQGGTIDCYSLSLAGKEWQLWSNVRAYEAWVTCDTTINGTVAIEWLETPVSSWVSAVKVDNCTLTVKGSVVGGIQLSHADLNVYGTIDTSSFGDVVRVYDGGKATNIAACDKLYLYPQSEVQSYTAAHCYFVRQLEAPTVMVTDQNGQYFATISAVWGATSYKLTLGDKEWIVPVDTTVQAASYALPAMDPGNYTLQVVAVGDDPDVLLDSVAATCEVGYFVKLDTPTFVVNRTQTEDGATSTVLVITNVPHAGSYNVTVNGKTLTVAAGDQANASVDISEYLPDVGTVVVQVQAAQNGNYLAGDTAMQTLVLTQQVELQAQVSVVDEKAVLHVNAGKGQAYYYSVVVKNAEGTAVWQSNVLATGQPEQDIVLLGGAWGTDIVEVTVQALTRGYYEPSTVVTVTYTAVPNVEE